MRQCERWKLNRTATVLIYVKDEVVRAWVHYNASLFGDRNLVVVYTDSWDGTWEVLQQLAQRYGVRNEERDEKCEKLTSVVTSRAQAATPTVDELGVD